MVVTLSSRDLATQNRKEVCSVWNNQEPIVDGHNDKDHRLTVTPHDR